VVPQLSNGLDISLFSSSPQNVPSEMPSFQDSSNLVNDAVDSSNNSLTAPGLSATEYHHDGLYTVHPPGVPDLAAVEWSYKDPTGQVQGKHPCFVDTPCS
jgi:PERQ amino acid-rich with GYF domain-containing protein